MEFAKSVGDLAGDTGMRLSASNSLQWADTAHLEPMWNGLRLSDSPDAVPEDDSPHEAGGDGGLVAEKETLAPKSVT